MKDSKLTRTAIFLSWVVSTAMLSSLRAEQITSVTASASSIISGNIYPMYAVNGAGLYGDAHTNSWQNVTWITIAGDINGAYFIIDLKKNYRFDPTNSLRVWNFNASGFTDYGLRSVTFSYSLDSLTFTNIAGVTTDATNFPATTFDQASGLNAYSNYNTVAFNSSLTGRYIKITVNGGVGVGNYGHASYAGLSEVQAFGALLSDPNDSLWRAIAVSNATASSTYTGYSVTNLINGSGLTGMRHDINAASTWFSANGVVSVTVDFDLWVTQNLGAMRVWNCNYSNPRYGMRTVDILVSDDPTFTSGVLTNYDDIELLIAPGTAGVYDNPQIIDMRDVSGRYVRISTVGNSSPNWGQPYLSLSEVQFFQALPSAGTIFTFR